MKQEIESQALKLMSMPGELRFASNGKWYHDDVEVSNRRIAQYFSRHLQFNTEQGCYVIAVGTRGVEVVIEDTPWVVTQFLSEQLPWICVLNNEQQREFRPDTLVVNSENVFYCQTEPESVLIRIQRSAMQVLLPLIEQLDGVFVLNLSGTKYPIGKV